MLVFPSRQAELPHQTLTGFTVRRWGFDRFAIRAPLLGSRMASRPVGIAIYLSRMSSVCPCAIQILSLGYSFSRFRIWVPCSDGGIRTRDFLIMSQAS